MPHDASPFDPAVYRAHAKRELVKASFATLATSSGQNSRVALSVPTRKVPLFPPYSIQRQGTGEILPLDDPAMRRLADSGAFRRISSKKDLRKPGQVIIRVTPGKRLSTYGFGFSPLQIARDPQSAMRSVAW